MGNKGLFVKGSNGEWVKILRAKKCRKKCGFMLDDRQCQGISGHDGPCWHYDEVGFLILTHRDAFRGSESIPPGHKSYITPEKMLLQTPVKNSTRTIVKDRKTIARLDKRILRNGEGMISPVSASDE